MYDTTLDQIKVYSFPPLPWTSASRMTDCGHQKMVSVGTFPNAAGKMVLIRSGRPLPPARTSKRPHNTSFCLMKQATNHCTRKRMYQQRAATSKPPLGKKRSQEGEPQRNVWGNGERTDAGHRGEHLLPRRNPQNRDPQPVLAHHRGMAVTGRDGEGPTPRAKAVGFGTLLGEIPEGRNKVFQPWVGEKKKKKSLNCMLEVYVSLVAFGNHRCSAAGGEAHHSHFSSQRA